MLHNSFICNGERVAKNTKTLVRSAHSAERLSPTLPRSNCLRW